LRKPSALGKGSIPSDRPALASGWKQLASGLALAVAAALPAVAQAAESAAVVTSIRPLGLIAAALTEGVSEPDILLADGASPHHYALKPSDMRRLMEAKVVFWVGPALEQFLDKPLSRTEAQTLALLPSSAAAEEHDHEHEEEHADEHADEHDAEHEAEMAEGGHDHDHGGVNVHPWLDPITAVEMAQQMHRVLVEQFPEQQAKLDANLERFTGSMQQIDQQISAQLAPVRERGFFVFHDAYDGFVGHYGLNQLGYFTVDPARKPGAKRLAEIRHQLEEQSAVCVLSEPQFNVAVVDAITDGLNVRQGQVDPLAIGWNLSATAYGDYLLDLAERFKNCLEP